MSKKKLTYEDVDAIKILLKSGKVQREIAEIYGVSISTISKIKSNKHYKKKKVKKTKKFKKRKNPQKPCKLCGILHDARSDCCVKCAGILRGKKQVAKGLRKINRCIDCLEPIAKKKYLRCHSCNMKNRWENEEYQEHCISSMRNSFYARWSDPEYREKMINQLTNYCGGSILEKNVAEIAKKFGFIRSVLIDKYLVDLINLDRKIIVEVNGDLWHCNPKFYKAEDVISFKKKTAKEIWEKDLLRKKSLESLGFRVYEIWEDDILKGKEDYINLFFSNLEQI